MDKLKVSLDSNRRNRKITQEREIQWEITKETKRDGKDLSKDKKAAQQEIKATKKGNYFKN